MKKRIDEYPSLYDFQAEATKIFGSLMKKYLSRLKYSSCAGMECDISYYDHGLFYAKWAIEKHERALGTLAINVECGEALITAEVSGTIEYITSQVLEYSTDGINYSVYAGGIDATLYTEVWFRYTAIRSEVSNIVLYAHIDNSEGACTKTTYYKRSLLADPESQAEVWGFAPNEAWGYAPDKTWGYAV